VVVGPVVAPGGGGGTDNDGDNPAPSNSCDANAVAASDDDDDDDCCRFAKIDCAKFANGKPPAAPGIAGAPVLKINS